MFYLTVMSGKYNYPISLFRTSLGGSRDNVQFKSIEKKADIHLGTDDVHLVWSHNIHATNARELINNDPSKASEIS